MNRRSRILLTAMLALSFIRSAAADKLETLRAQLAGRGCSYHYEYDLEQHLQRCREAGAAEGLLGGLLNRGYKAAELRCVTAAAGCLAEMGSAAKEALGDLLAQIKSGADVYDTGDGLVEVRPILIQALKPFADDARIAPLIAEVLAGDSSIASKTAAAEIAEDLGARAKSSEPGLAALAAAANAPARGAASKALLAVGSPQAIPLVRASLGAASDEYEVPAVLIKTLSRYPDAARTLLPELRRLLAVLTDEAPWDAEIGAADSVAAVDKIYFRRYWLSDAFISSPPCTELDLAAARPKLPCIGCGAYQRWQSVRDSALARIAAAGGASLEDRCTATLKMARSGNREVLAPLAAALRDPLHDFDQTYIAIQAYYAVTDEADAVLDALMALARDLGDDAVWEARLNAAPSAAEKRRLFNGRILLAQYSQLSGLLWLRNFRDKAVLDALPRNMNAGFRRWQEAGTRAGLPRQMPPFVRCF